MTNPPASTHAPAPASGPSNANSADPSRGVPYYEKLRRDLRETLQKKRVLDKNLVSLEDQIYRLENAYLEETSAGNIIKGFDNYVKGSITGSVSLAGSLGLSAGGGGGGIGIGGGGGGHAGTGRRRGGVNEMDRVFSRSSASYLKDASVSTPTSAHTTPSYTQTPTSSFALHDSNHGAGGSGTAGPTGGGPGGGGGGGGTGSARNPKKKKGATAAATAATAAAAAAAANANADATANATAGNGAVEDGPEPDGGNNRKRMKFTFGGRGGPSDT